MTKIRVSVGNEYFMLEVSGDISDDFRINGCLLKVAGQQVLSMNVRVA